MLKKKSQGEPPLSGIQYSLSSNPVALIRLKKSVWSKVSTTVWKKRERFMPFANELEQNETDSSMI